MKRKIAIIADGWRRHITYVWIRGCRNYIKEHELDIEISVFHSFGNFSRDEKFNAGEYNIIHLPDLSQFDGIILEVTNMLNQKKRQQIIRIIQESGVPAISLLEKIPGLYHAGPDNYATMEQMVEHLITDRGLRRCHTREKSLLRQPWIFWYRSGGRIQQLTVKRFLYKCCFRIVVAVNQNR